MKLSEDIMKQWGIPDQKCDGRGLGAVAVNLKSGTEKTFGCNNDRIKSFVLYVWVWVNMIRLEIDTLVIIYSSISSTSIRFTNHFLEGPQLHPGSQPRKKLPRYKSSFASPAISHLSVNGDWSCG